MRSLLTSAPDSEETWAEEEVAISNCQLAAEQILLFTITVVVVVLPLSQGHPSATEDCAEEARGT